MPGWVPTEVRFMQFELGSEWSEESVDICWMDCSELGFLCRPDHVRGYELVLCVSHARELEATADLGYSCADPPRDSAAKWWPWQPIEPDRWKLAA